MAKLVSISHYPSVFTVLSVIISAFPPSRPRLWTDSPPFYFCALVAALSIWRFPFFLQASPALCYMSIWSIMRLSGADWPWYPCASGSSCLLLSTDCFCVCVFPQSCSPAHSHGLHLPYERSCLQRTHNAWCICLHIAELTITTAEQCWQFSLSDCSCSTICSLMYARTPSSDG